MKLIILLGASALALSACQAGSLTAQQCAILVPVAGTAIGMANTIDYTKAHQEQADIVAGGVSAIVAGACP